jgi:predicted enzyme related to lactoylglutathione lyase
VFLDFPTATFERACSFWQGVTGYTLSAPRGTAAQFGTLEPRPGEPYLRLQRTEGNRSACHLDLHVDDVDVTVRQATAWGARIEQDRPNFVVMSSPGGLPFCLVSAGKDHVFERPPPTAWPSGHSSLVDQLCLDIPPATFSTEAPFWEALTGWERRRGSRPEFEYLVRPLEMPIRLLLQRLDDQEAGSCRAHVDLACDNVPAERLRHEDLGAVVVAEPSWTTLHDPTGLAYCITRRDPVTGTLAKP